jgi:Asp-tRNA(Asn)/Glu-tRNA(Gln) amidotransferase A subunit family amidase
MVKQKTISPVQLVKAHLDRIERFNPLLNAFVALDADRALLAARSAEAAVMHGKEFGPLHGVPITLKSSIDVAGLALRSGFPVARRISLKQMQHFPALLCSVCSIPAFRHRERSWQVNGRTVQYLEAMSYAQWANILGLPAVVVPVAKSREGLPIGVQVIGRPWEEEVVLAVGAEIEHACGGWQEPPMEP